MIPFTQPVDVSDKRGLPERAAARLLIIDPQNRLLLFRCHPPGQPPVWAMAQGAIPEAYGSIDGDVREVVARTGLNATLGQSVDLRDHVHAGENGALERWIVWTFLVVADGGEPGADLWTAGERAIVGEHRWWSLDGLRATTEAIHPAFLAGLLSAALTSLGRFLVVTDGPMGDMRWYARIRPHPTSMGFVDVEPRDGGLGGLAVVEHGAIAWRWTPGARYLARPLRWAREHDVRNWRVFTARNGRERVGGAVVALDTPEAAPPHGRRDRALLWDIRQDGQSGHHVSGIREALFHAAAAWARARGCRWLIGQTAGFDTESYGFFTRLGCELGAIHRFAVFDDDGEGGDHHAGDGEVNGDGAGNDACEPRFTWYFDLRERGDPDPPAESATAKRAAVLPAAEEITVGDATVTDGPMGEMDDYARIPIAFEVRSVLEVEVRDGGGGLLMHERAVDSPWVKDYDEGEERPQRWARRFDVSNWRVFEARSGGRLVGGAVVAWDTPGVEMLEGRRDLAVLWDIRVLPGARGHGVGAALFRAAGAWARERGCRWMKIETQNVNVPACCFYARMGCELGAIDRFAYPELPGEAQLLWYLDLRASGISED